MLYDDVDVNIVDSNDSFGIYKTTDSTRSTLPKNVKENENFPKTPKNVFHKSIIRREHTTVSETKFQSKLSKKNKPENDLLMFSSSDSDKMFDKKFDSKMQPDPSVSIDFQNKIAVTFQDKLAVLEDRDKYLRETVFKDTNKNMNVIVVGTCPDMCPEKERLLREINCSFSVFEGQIVQNEMLVVPELLVKEYSRSSADQDEPLPHELRPEPVLMDTMSHILINIVPKIEDNSLDLSEWYHFCWDRLRSLRKDIIQQQLCSTNIVKILEQSARFHICCADRLFDKDRRVFDEKLNAENLVNCLQMLINMYEDLEAEGVRCENETEFRVYMMLLLLNNGDVPDVLRFSEDDDNTQSHNRVSEAVEIFFAFKLKLYTKFFKLIKKTSYLNACILQRYFGGMRTQILNVLVNSYSSGSKTAKFSLEFVRRMLEFDNDEETTAFVESHGYTVDYEVGEVRGSKSIFTIPDVKPVCKSSYILVEKRTSMLEAITKVKNFMPEIRLTKVHSSFHEDDTLKKSAWDAQDQQNRVVQLYGNIYEKTENEFDSSMAFSLPEISPKKTESAFSFKLEQPDIEEQVFQHSQIMISNTPTSSQPVFSFATFGKNSAETENRTHAFDFSMSEKLSPTPSPNFAITGFIFEKVPPPIMPVEVAQSNTYVAEVPNFETSGEHSVIEPDPSSLYDPEEEYESSIPENEVFEQNPTPQQHEIINLRKVEEVADNLSKVLSEFQRLYYTHIPQMEDDAAVKNVVKEAAEARSIVKWKVLGHESSTVKFLGMKLAETLVQNVRIQYAKSRRKLSPVICWKMLLSLPQSDCDSSHSFMLKISEFSRILFYESQENELGNVQVVRCNGVKVCTSVNINVGVLDIDTVMTGLTGVVAFINENWNDMQECEMRLSSILCDCFLYPVFVNLVVIGECTFKSSLESFMTSLQKKRIVIGWKLTQWQNFYTIPKVVFEACRYIPQTPPFQVRSLCSFMENVGSDFFLNLFCMPNNKEIENTPVAYIKLYNEFLSNLKRILNEENTQKYNLSTEFLSHIIGQENSCNNLTQKELALSALMKYTLISFTKWPPKSVRKLEKLLTEYCSCLDLENTLLPNVIRLINASLERAKVNEICAEAPWLKIVELWFRYNWHFVSKSMDSKKTFIFYDESRVKDAVESLWVQKRMRIENDVVC